MNPDIPENYALPIEFGEFEVEDEADTETCYF